VYICDFKPAARELALELGATEAFDLIELTKKTAEGFTVDTTIDFVANNPSECHKSTDKPKLTTIPT
jgi:propanol-preferring alcohol dehydrogenase